MKSFVSASVVVALSLALAACGNPGNGTGTAYVSGRVFLRQGAKPLVSADAPGMIVQSLLAESHAIPGEVVVRYKSNTSNIFQTMATGEATQVLRVPKGQEVQTVAQLQNRSDVEYAGLNYSYKTLATPNDPKYSSQYNLPMVGMPAAWDVFKGSDVLVAVLDNGYVAGDTDLVPRLALGAVPNGFFLDAADKDQDPSTPKALEFHGHAVASVIAAVSNNATQIAGVAWEGVRVAPVKVFKNDGTGNSESIALGIESAIQLGAQVINLSLCLNDATGKCITTPDPVLEAALKKAYERGIVIVAAAGNDGSEGMGYPASSRYAMSVGSITNTKVRSSFSNYGAGLDLVAPGSAVPVLDPSKPTGAAIASGTSFSAPHVAGVAALLKGRGIASPDVIYSRILASTEDLGATGRDNQFGNGLLRADKALENNTVYDPAASYPLFITFTGPGGTRKFSTRFQAGRNTGGYDISGLAQGSYTVRAHLDINRNGAEDTGDYAGNANFKLEFGALYGQDIVLDKL